MHQSSTRTGSIAAVRGAVGVSANSPEAILEATATLLRELVERNGLAVEQLVSVLLTATPDLDAEFPAHAARRLGWSDVPLLCAREIDVPGAPGRIVRVLVTVRDAASPWLTPVYLGEARKLRPDLEHGPDVVPEALGATAQRPGAAAARSPAVAGRPAGSAQPEPVRTRHRVAIIGLGQIGGSIGLGLGAAGGWRRIGHDALVAAALAARDAGAIDEVADSIEAACSRATIAVLAVPVDELPSAIARAAAALPRGAEVLDTGSARRGLERPLAEAARRGVRAVGGHPIAGSEGRGFPAARADLFRGAPFGLMPVARDVPDEASRLVADLGARVIVCEPDEHDRSLARTSHLPYLLACALADAGRDAAARSLSGPAFRDMTRLAASDPRVAGAYCRANIGEVRSAWDELRADVERRLAALDGPAG